MPTPSSLNRIDPDLYAQATAEGLSAAVMYMDDVFVTGLAKEDGVISLLRAAARQTEEDSIIFVGRSRRIYRVFVNQDDPGFTCTEYPDAAAFERAIAEASVGARY